jgi:hypothetical protein
MVRLSGPLLKSQRTGISILDDINDVGAKRGIFENLTSQKKFSTI